MHTNNNKLSGNAQALLRELTAPERHFARIKVTVAAAGRWLESHPDPVDADSWELAAAAVLLLDIFGVRGPMGLGVGLGSSAQATDRPLLGDSGLGSGRRHAKDGGAYIAAAAGALQQLIGVRNKVVVKLVDDDKDKLLISFSGDEPDLLSLTTVGVQIYGLPPALGESIRRSCAYMELAATGSDKTDPQVVEELKARIPGIRIEYV